jgi:hypothetical protein
MLTAPPDAGGPELAVALDPDGNLKLGQTFKVRITSPVDGYLALFDLKADNTVVQIFPNARSEALGRSGRIRARAPTTLPDESYGFEMIADRPTGRGRIIALVAADRARLQAALKPGDGLKPLSDGPRTFETLQTALGPKRANGAGGLAWVSQFLDYYVSER